MRISGALVSATALFVLGSVPRLAEAQCGVTDVDYIVNEAQGTIVAWANIQEIFTEYCPWAGGYQWGYFEHHYATTVQIESPTGQLAYGEDYQVMAYGGGSASAIISISYIGDPGAYDIQYSMWAYCTIGGLLGSGLDGDGIEIPCPSSVTISAPPNNPNPNDALWTTNFSFLTADQIAAYASPGGIWTITPAGPANAGAQPVYGIGASHAFLLSFPHPPYTPGPTGGSLDASTALTAGISVWFCVSDFRQIRQDTRDVIRQEYRNHSITIPTREQFNVPVATTDFLVSEINFTAYPIIVGTPGNIAQNTRDSWNALIGQQVGGGPTDHGLIITSAWRNPERNENQNGELTSDHQYGKAVDVKISSIATVVAATGLSAAQLWQLLADAGDAVGNAFCENGPTQVPCTNTPVTHVHVDI